MNYFGERRGLIMGGGKQNFFTHIRVCLEYFHAFEGP